MDAYIIPPYILNTSLGAKLQLELSNNDGELAKTNSLSIDSSLFEAKPQIAEVPKHRFSSNNIINGIIKDKLVYKLGIIGVLGTSPKSSEEFEDEEIFELFEIFKHRLLSEDKDDNKKLFSEAKYGEVIINENSLPNKYKKFLTYTLKDLLLISKLESNSQISSKPSFLKFDYDNYFQYSLPSSWISLIPSSVLGVIDHKLELSTNHIEGYCNIELNTLKQPSDIGTALLPTSSKYFNFISNKPVPSSVGIYYYELEIIQECTKSTENIPLLSIQDATISSNQSPRCNVGFVKRFINYDNNNNNSSRRSSNAINSPVTNNNGGESPHYKIDLEDVKNELVFNQDNVINRPLNVSYETLLDSKPGEFKGSFAIDLSDSKFYNSIKSQEPRASILNMNRRLSSLTRLLEESDSKIDTEVNFSTSVENISSKKTLKSDIIGIGIDYIKSSIFLTLNGVLIKLISKEELQCTNPLSDNLFSTENNNDVYPMIGFMLNEVHITNKFEPTKLKIKTNLGFRDFKFNINNYIKDAKNKISKDLNLSILQSSGTFSNKINNYDNNNNKDGNNIGNNNLNDLIKEYLNSEGYTETYKSLNKDLHDLKEVMDDNDNVKTSKGLGNNKYDNDDIITMTDGLNRNLLRQYFKNFEFQLILNLINEEYQEIFNDDEGNNLVFEVKCNYLIYKLKNYIQLVMNNGENETEYQEIWKVINYLNLEYKHDEVKYNKLKNVSILILVKTPQHLENLPVLNSLLNKFDEKNEILFNKINKKILKYKGYNEISTLENIVKTVDNNINELNLKFGDNNFALINFARDELDL